MEEIRVSMKNTRVVEVDMNRLDDWVESICDGRDCEGCPFYTGGNFKSCAENILNKITYHPDRHYIVETGMVFEVVAKNTEEAVDKVRKMVKNLPTCGMTSYSTREK